MPFGLKNAPQAFQRKMDEVFNDCKQFTVVYIDDVLVFSKTYKEHISHLYTVLTKMEAHGLVVSKPKMKLAKTHIEFLGTEIGEGKISLQPHITQKILSFPDKIEETKQLRSFLGLLNYARPYIKDLGKIIGCLYAKTSEKGQKYFNRKDIEVVQQVKQLVKNLPKLSLPLDSDYLIIQTDGCESGWGGILLRKKNKYAPKNTEEICRYAYENFREKGQMTSLDYELLAVNYVLDSFYLYIVGRPEVTLRTDCENIVKYSHQTKDNKKHNTRWLTFHEKLINRGMKIVFEHIKGQDNKEADILSRLTSVYKCLQEPHNGPQKEENIIFLSSYNLLSCAGKQEEQKAQKPNEKGQ